MSQSAGFRHVKDVRFDLFTSMSTVMAAFFRSGTPCLVRTQCVGSQARPGMLALCIAAMIHSPAAQAQTTTERIPVSLDIESADTGEGNGRCVASIFARFEDVPGALRYTLHGWDPLFWGTPFTISGPPFDDNFAWQGIPAGPIPVPPPSGMHQFFLTGGSAPCAAQIALLESWIEGRYNFSGYDWHVEVLVEERDPPVATFTWEVDENNPLKVAFDASGSSDPDGQIGETERRRLTGSELLDV